MDKLPPVGTNGYDNLGYHDKLFILNLYLFDRDKYNLLVGYGRSTTGFYIDQKITHLARTGKLGTPSDSAKGSISIEEGYWGAYLCYFDQVSFQSKGVDLLVEYDVEYERAFGVNLFSFPVLRTDFLGKEILNWVFNSELHSVCIDPVFSLATMRVASDALVPNAPERVMIAKRAKTKKRIKELASDPQLIKNNMTPVTVSEIYAISLNFFQTLNEAFDFTLGSVIDMAGDFIQPSELFEDIETEELVLLSNKCRKFGKWWYAPILPVALFKDSRFTVKDWSFLHSESNGSGGS